MNDQRSQLGDGYMVVIPDYIDERITRRIDEIATNFPDVDRGWLRNEILHNFLVSDVPPEAISIAPKETP